MQMEKFILRSGETSETMSPSLTQRHGKKQSANMAADKQRAKKSNRPSTAGTSQEGESEAGDSEITTTNLNTELSCKQLAVEVAKILAPDIKASLESTVAESLSQLQRDVSSHTKQITELEERLSSVEDMAVESQAQLQKLAGDNQALREKVDDLENRSRRSNLRIVGLPESVLPHQLLQICSTELPRVLGMPGNYAVERAHRIGTPRGPHNRDQANNQRPRQIIVKYLNYADKAQILQSYRKAAAPVLLQGHKILMFADFSAEVARKRRAYAPICTAMVRKQIKFFLQFPATLRIIGKNGAMEQFSSPEEASAFLESWNESGSDQASVSSPGQRD